MRKKQPDKQTNQRYLKHNLLCQGGNKLERDISVYLILMHKKNLFKRLMENKETANEEVAECC